MKLIQNNKRFSIADVTGVTDTLPGGVYQLQRDPATRAFFLLQKEAFELPKKIYGDISIVDRWIKSYKNNTQKNLGIILSGTKGSGKTITAQKFCIDTGLPVILITEEFYGSDFIDFLTNPILGKCILFIDEYEKIYPRDENSHDLLQIMDGNFNTQLVFLMTVNTFRINSYLVNRLNRIKYRKHYDNLELSIVQEVIDDMLINKTHTQSIYDFFDRIGICTFDLLVNLIKEMNLFGEDAIICGKHLNLETESIYYDVTEIFKEVTYPCFSTNLSSDEDSIAIERKLSVDKEPTYLEIDLTMDGWVKQKLADGVFVLENKEKGYHFRFTPSKTSLAF